MVLSEDAREGHRLQEKEPGELVSQVLHGAGERAGGERRLLLAARGHAGGSTGDRAVVFENHGLCRPAAGRFEDARRRVAGSRYRDAAELDWKIGRREDFLFARWMQRQD